MEWVTLVGQAEVWILLLLATVAGTTKLCTA
ncbi:hypothetical protein EV586_11162 [Tumebacillus sp. BK434]|nr:hypothetical protein EV586_11162 [Tumebacillus sp. BK434]